MDDILEKLKSALVNTKPEDFKENSTKETFEEEWEQLITKIDLSSFNNNYYTSTVHNGGNVYGLTGPSGGPTTTITNPGAKGASGPFIPPSFTGSSNIGNYAFNNYTNNPSLKVSGDAHFEGDIKIKGRSIMDILTAIEKRLAILIPDPDKLEHFEALKKAYEHYQTLESLCSLPDKQEEK